MDFYGSQGPKLYQKNHQQKLRLKTLTILEQTIYHYGMQIYDPKVFTPFTVIMLPLFTHILVKNMPVNTQLSQAHRLSRSSNI